MPKGDWSLEFDVYTALCSNTRNSVLGCGRRPVMGLAHGLLPTPDDIVAAQGGGPLLRVKSSHST